MSAKYKTKSSRSLSFRERRQDLIGSLGIIDNALRDCERTGAIYPLRVVAVQLRALIADRKNSLLLNLADEKGFILTVYAADPLYLDQATRILGQKPVFYSTGDALALERDKMFPIGTPLDQALNMVHVSIAGEELSLWEIIRLVADKEAAHYDKNRPQIMDSLMTVEIGGLPAAYRTIYALGRLVVQIGYKFVQIT